MDKTYHIAEAKRNFGVADEWLGCPFPKKPSGNPLLLAAIACSLQSIAASLIVLTNEISREDEGE